MLLDISLAQSKAGDRDGALASIRAAEAESNGRKTEDRYPNWPCTLATAMLDQDLRDEALRTLQQAARDVPDAPANPNQGHEAAYKLSEIAREQVRAGDVEHARDNVKRIEAIAASALAGKSKRNAGLLLPLLAGAQAEIGDLDGAFAALDRTKELGPEAEQARTKVASRIGSKAGGLDPQAARRIVDRLNHEIADARVVEVKWAMRQALITPLAKLGEIEKARDLAKELAREMGGGPRQEAMKAFALLQKITYAQEAAGDDAGARESLHVSFDAVRGAVDTDLGRSHIRSIAMSLAYLGDLDGALQIAESLQPGQELGDVYPYVTWKLALEGKTDRANEVLRRSREELAAAWKELPDDRSKALEFDPSKAASALEVAMTVHALAGEVDEALASYRQIPGAGGNYRQRALTTLVITVARSGEFRKALTLALGCDDPEDKRRALQDVAMGVAGRLMVEAQGRRPADAKPKNVE
jgi:tetratricopeptide (TPR) repeat protein